eukprot:c27363_g1_i3 orf=738-2069(-)
MSDFAQMFSQAMVLQHHQLWWMPSLPSFLCLLSLLCSCCYSSSTLFPITGYSPEDLASESRLSLLFDAWCERYNKFYNGVEGGLERLRRFTVFKENLSYIDAHNRGNSSYWLALNEFADLTNEEFRGRYMGLSMVGMNTTHQGEGKFVPREGSIPKTLDWREKGAVTGVKNQGGCGVCWAFSTTGAIEGINKIVIGDLISLSEQELLDCDTIRNFGCRGGLMDYAFQWVINNGGIHSEEDYPYVGQQQSCLKKAVAGQPVSVGINGGGRDFQLYSGGVFTGACTLDLDHAVLIVGYGSEDGKDYWIIKNSWGKSWGMNGFGFMARSLGPPEGICGINKLASYPIKTGPNPPFPGPGPTPKPVKCDIFHSCPAESTCCCRFHIGPFCFSWGCCALKSAVCCADRRHCCPTDHPFCKTKTGECLQSSQDVEGVPALENEKASLKW